METKKKPAKLPSFSMGFDKPVDNPTVVQETVPEPVEVTTEPAKPKTRVQAKRQQADEQRKKTKSQVTVWVPDTIKLEAERILYEYKQATGKRKSLTAVINELLENYVKNDGKINSK